MAKPTASHDQTAISVATRFFSLIVAIVPRGYIELRPIRPGGGALKPSFFPVADPAAAAARALELGHSADVYFGVAPRSQESGKGSAVDSVTVLWADIDTEDSRDRLESFELQPSIIVGSGTGENMHVYWLLTEPIPADEAEELLKRLASQIGADPRATDRGRILRVPETLNHKAKPPTPVVLKHCDEIRYSVAEFRAALDLPDQDADDDVELEGDDPRHTDDWETASEPVRRVLRRLEGVRGGDGQWMAHCPAHDDARPSLRIAQGDDGRCLIHCFAGCETGAVITALGLKMSDLFREAPPKRKISSGLVQLAEQAGIELFHTEARVAHAVIEVGGHRETWRLRSDGFKLWLRQLHYGSTEEALADDVLSEAIATLEAQALFDGEQHEVHRRVAGHGDRLLIDRGDEDWTAIEVTPDGWGVVEDPDAHFVRDPTAQALPLPVRGGSIEELREFANCADEGSWLRLVGAMVMCFHPYGLYPVIYPTGEQGSAKSTVSRLISSLVDPRSAPLQMGNPSIRDLAVLADNVRLVGFDNVSKVSPALSDALCQLATGGGYRTRKLYTDGDPFVLDLKRPILLNGIGRVIERPDLLDRVALIELAPIPPEKRRTEADLEAAWEEARPRILGAILDGLVAAIGRADEVELAGFPRMAECARWGEAAGTAFGWPPGAFTAALESSRQELPGWERRRPPRDRGAARVHGEATRMDGQRLRVAQGPYGDRGCDGDRKRGLA